MSDQNWRTDIDAGDYFLHQKKELQLSNRRPVIRRASDLVGPGIGEAAVRITDYNNLLATFNGYFSSAPGALNAPNSTDAFIGQVISDAELGGRQVFTSMTTGAEYSRAFNRSPVDPESIGWGAWSGQRVPPSAQSTTTDVWTDAPTNSPTVLAPPFITTIGEASGTSTVYERSDVGIMLRKHGVYTGTIQVCCGTAGFTVDTIRVDRPEGAVTTNVNYENVAMDSSFLVPFTVWALDELQGFSVRVLHTEASTSAFWWRFSCTRVGDAV